LLAVAEHLLLALLLVVESALLQLELLPQELLLLEQALLQLGPVLQDWQE
jgi:hypothetical protein